MGKLAELEDLTKPYLSKLREDMQKMGYSGTFVFEYHPEDEREGIFSTQYLLHQSQSHVSQSDK